jgi:alpha-amylase
MLRVSEMIEKLRAEPNTDRSEIAEAEDFLWRGQCNCPYWHGVFGGLYLPHIRAAVYQNLIMAEKILDRVTKKRDHWTRVSMLDFDRDGRDELVVESPDLSFFFSPSSGASLCELDYRAAHRNLVDCITRQEEGYHSRIESAQAGEEDSGGTVSIHEVFSSKERGLEKLLSYDWYRRGCFIDHFFGKDAEVSQFMAAVYPEEGDFVNQPYAVDHKTVGKDCMVRFSRDGGVWFDGRQAKVRLEKEFVIQAARPELEVRYQIANEDDITVNLHFGIEFNFGFPNLTSPKVSYTIGGEIPARFKHLHRVASADGISQFGLHNGEDNFTLDFLLQKKSTLWRVPIYTVSLSEEGFEKVQQGICVVPSWKLRLMSGESWQLQMIVRFKELDPAQAKRVATVSLARA